MFWNLFFFFGHMKPTSNCIRVLIIRNKYHASSLSLGMSMYGSSATGSLLLIESCKYSHSCRGFQSQCTESQLMFWFKWVSSVRAHRLHRTALETVWFKAFLRSHSAECYKVTGWHVTVPMTHDSKHGSTGNATQDFTGKYFEYSSVAQFKVNTAYFLTPGRKSGARSRNELPLEVAFAQALT